MKLKDWLNRDASTPWPYQQVDLIKRRSKRIEDPGGVCFRLAFKWVACQVYGRPFKFDIAQVNADSVMMKQWTYLKAISPFEKKVVPGSVFRGDPYERFVTNVDRISTNQLNVWGNKTNRYNLTFRSNRCREIVGRPEFDRDVAMVIGLYGRYPSPWAHATAFYRKGEQAKYFDSNGGEFDCDRGDDIAGMIREDVARYAMDGFTLNEFALYVVTGS